MIYKILGLGSEFKELEIGENDEELGITIVDNDNETNLHIKIPRVDFEAVVKSMEYMKENKNDFEI
jgi:hypothetical protein